MGGWRAIEDVLVLLRNSKVFPSQTMDTKVNKKVLAKVGELLG
jgi:hypothetical protein